MQKKKHQRVFLFPFPVIKKENIRKTLWCYFYEINTTFLLR